MPRTVVEEAVFFGLSAGVAVLRDGATWGETVTPGVKELDLENPCWDGEGNYRTKAVLMIEIWRCATL